MDQYSIGLTTIGALVLIIGVFSAVIRSSLPVSEALLSLGVGVLLGPHVTGLLDIGRWGESHLILERAAEVTLAIALMGVALRIPKKDIFRRIRTVALLLGLLMPLMWLTSGLVVHLLLGLPWLVSLLAGACLAPTDPVVASSIVVGKAADENLTEDVRTTLSEESGFNDGLAYPLVFLPMLLLLRHTPGAALKEWLLDVVLWKVGAALVLGAAIGFGAGRVLEKAMRSKVIEKTSVLSYSAALAVVTLGAARLIGSDGLFAVFIAGLAFDLAVRQEEQTEEEGMEEAFNRFFTLPIFALFGVALPWADWAHLGVRGVAMAALILLVRRLPWMLLLHPILRGVHGRRDALFLGWFGPLGVAPLYYAVHVLGKTPHYAVWPVVSLAIAASVVAHGITSLPLTRVYGHSRAKS